MVNSLMYIIELFLYKCQSHLAAVPQSDTAVSRYRVESAPFVSRRQLLVFEWIAFRFTFSISRILFGKLTYCRCKPSIAFGIKGIRLFAIRFASFLEWGNSMPFPGVPKCVRKSSQSDSLLFPSDSLYYDPSLVQTAKRFFQNHLP